MKDALLNQILHHAEDDDAELEDAKPDFFQRVFESQILKAAGVDVRALEAERAEGNLRVAEHYQKQAAEVTAPAAKRAVVREDLAKKFSGIEPKLRHLAKQLAAQRLLELGEDDE